MILILSVVSVIETEKGKGTVKEVDILNKKYKVETKENGIIEMEV